jgi:hypothetical protein
MSPFYRLTELEVRPAMAAAGSTNPPVRQQLGFARLAQRRCIGVYFQPSLGNPRRRVGGALLADAPRTPGEVSRKLTLPRNSNVAMAPPIADYRGDHGLRTTGSAH